MSCMTRVGQNFLFQKPKASYPLYLYYQQYTIFDGLSILKCSLKEFVNLNQLFAVGCTFPNFYSKDQSRNYKAAKE